jgi:hypothetical protein
MNFPSDLHNAYEDWSNLALLLKDTNRLSEAEPLMRRALAIEEASFGPDHPDRLVVILQRPLQVPTHCLFRSGGWANGIAEWFTRVS